MKKNFKFIAELCQNHLGKIKLIEEMVKRCAKNGSSIVKIQHIFAEDLSERYQFENGLTKNGKILCITRPYENEFKRLKKLELNKQNLIKFIKICKKFNVEPAITCFNRSRVDEIYKLGFKTIKVASYDCGSYPLIKDLIKKFKKIIVSTGASYKHEIEKCSKILSKSSCEYSMLHCTTIYPTPLDKINIFKIKFLKSLCKTVGFSDHSNSIGINKDLASKLAIFYGAEIIERHITILDYNKTRDGIVSLYPEDIREIINFSNLSKNEQKKHLLNKYKFNFSILKKGINYKLSHVEKLNRDYYRGRFVSKIDNEKIFYNWEDF